MISEVETTIKNYKENKKAILEYASLTSNENVKIEIKNFVNEADAFINTYYKIQDARDLGEVINTERVVYKGNEDKDTIENLKSYMRGLLGNMEYTYNELKKEEVDDIEKEGYSLVLTSMEYTIELFKITIGIATEERKDSIKEVGNYHLFKKEISNSSYI